jgi:hypothetical protein
MDVIQEIEDAVEALLDLDDPGKPVLSERKAAAVRRRYNDALIAANDHIEDIEKQLSEARNEARMV